MRKLKIIQILPTLNTGGVERGVLDFNKYLVDKGHESYVISNGGRQVKNIIKDGGTHIHLQVSKKSIFTLLQAKKLADIINEISPDIVSHKVKDTSLGLTNIKAIPQKSQTHHIFNLSWII